MSEEEVGAQTQYRKNKKPQPDPAGRTGLFGYGSLSWIGLTFFKGGRVRLLVHGLRPIYPK
jgi:hypothetical protein